MNTVNKSVFEEKKDTLLVNLRDLIDECMLKRP